MDNKLYVSSSPHFNFKCSTQMIMGTVLFALLPEIIMGIVLFRWAALIRILVSVASCVLFEFLFQKVTKQKVVIANLSACVTGVMMALVCPPTAPVWMFVVGAAVAMIVAKGLFGGIGSNVFNENYGTELPNLIGIPQTALTLLKVQSTIANAIENIQKEQSLNYDIISDDERLLKMDNFQIQPSENPKNLVVSFEIYTLSGQNVNIGVTI